MSIAELKTGNRGIPPFDAPPGITQPLTEPTVQDPALTASTKEAVFTSEFVITYSNPAVRTATETCTDIPSESDTGYFQPYLFDVPPSIYPPPLPVESATKLEAVSTSLERSPQWVKKPNQRIRVIFESSLQQRQFTPGRPVNQENLLVPDEVEDSGYRVEGEFQRFSMEIADRPVTGFLGRLKSGEQLFVGFPFGRRAIPANAPRYQLNGAGKVLEQRQDPVDLTQDSDVVHAGAVDRLMKNWDVLAPLIVKRPEKNGKGLRVLKELNFNDYAIIPPDAENPNAADVPRCGIADLAGEFPTTDWGVFEFGSAIQGRDRRKLPQLAKVTRGFLEVCREHNAGEIPRIHQFFAVYSPNEERTVPYTILVYPMASRYAPYIYNHTSPNIPTKSATLF